MTSPDPSTQPETVPPLDAAPDGPEYGHWLDLVGLVLRAPLRRRGLAASVLVIGVLATVAAVLFTPRVYVVTTRILAQRNLVMPSLGNPRRSVPSDSDAPTRAASDMILGRDNLVAMIREADLVARWERERPPLLRVGDRITSALSDPLTDAERERALVSVLQKSLRVQTSDSTIRITVEWSDPQTAFDIVSLAQRTFLSQKSDLEISIITDTIGILTVESERQRTAVDEAFSRVVQIHGADLASDAGLASSARARPSAPRSVAAKPAAPGAAAVEAARDEPPELTSAKETLLVATRRYEDLMDRIDSARIELQSAQAAFKYRYTIVEPPELPRKAARPSAAVLGGFGLVLGVLLAIFVTAAADLTGHRFVEVWQVRSRLGVPILATVEEP